MANTYSQLYIHIVFATKYRETSISPLWKDQLQKYITGIVRNQGQKLIAINCMPDHAHIFIGMKPDIALSSLVRDVKRDSTNFVNDVIHPRGRFAWQEGFGAFSHCRSEIGPVVRYILGQEEHHKNVIFRNEYVGLLRTFGINYDERYIFETSQETLNS